MGASKGPERHEKRVQQNVIRQQQADAAAAKAEAEKLKREGRAAAGRSLQIGRRSFLADNVSGSLNPSPRANRQLS